MLFKLTCNIWNGHFSCNTYGNGGQCYQSEDQPHLLLLSYSRSTLYLPYHGHPHVMNLIMNKRAEALANGDSTPLVARVLIATLHWTKTVTETVCKFRQCTACDSVGKRWQKLRWPQCNRTAPLGSHPHLWRWTLLSFLWGQGRPCALFTTLNLRLIKRFFPKRLLKYL